MFKLVFAFGLNSLGCIKGFTFLRRNNLLLIKENLHIDVCLRLHDETIPSKVSWQQMSAGVVIKAD